MRCSVRELEVITRLNGLNANRDAVINLPERYKMLEAKAYSIKAASTDKEPVSGGTSRGEDQRIENLIERDHVTQDLEYARKEVKQLESAVLKLTPNERKVVEKLFINRPQNVEDEIKKLCDELNYERAQIFRIRHAAINKLGDILYGTRRK